MSWRASSGPGEGTGAPVVPVADALARVDWATTAFGPPSTWPATLTTMVEVLLGSRFSMWMGWGPDLTFFYNDAYARDTLAAKHPAALGQPTAAVWSEIWDDIRSRIEHVLETGEATWDEDLLLFVERLGFPEETYHTFSYSPVVDAGATVGLLCVVSEETSRVVNERRMTTLRLLATAFASATGRDEIAAALHDTLEANRFDVPFSLTYLLDEDGGHRLLTATGVEPGSAFAPTDLTSGSAGAWPLDDARLGEVQVVENLAGRFGSVPTGAWDEPPEAAAIVAFDTLGQGSPSGVLVVGLNPFRPFDEGYTGFLELVAGQIEAAVRSAEVFESERRRSEALAELDRAKTAFFTNISHEFRTPLTLLLSPLEDALAALGDGSGTSDGSGPGDGGGLGPEGRVGLELAHRNALRLLKLVNALLDFSRLEAGRLHANVEPVALAEETAEVAGMFRSAIEAGGVALVVDCPPLDRPVLVDRHMWELIVTNLVSNAFKHTFAGSITVRVCAEAATKELVLEVVDTGSGIPESAQPQLFSRFHRVEGAPSRSHEGSGVGLSLVRELVELHGGRVEAQSELGRGSTFIVRIPHVPASDGPLRLDDGPRSRTIDAHLSEVNQWASAARTEEVSETADGTVLVVDDNADMREYLTRLLSARYRVTTAADGAEALEQLQVLQPDLVVSDVMMPEVDGLDLVARLRADPRHHDVPVILLSARAGPEASVEGLDAGADDYLVKPFSADELLGRVAARLATGSERRRNRVLGELSEALRDAPDRSTVVCAVHDATTDLLGQSLTGLGVIDDELVYSYFAPTIASAVGERYHVVEVASQVPIAVVARDGRPMVADSFESFAEQFPAVVDDQRAAGVDATVVVPVHDATGGRMGVLSASWPGPHAVDDELMATLHQIARVTGQALERLRRAEDDVRLAEAIQGQLLEVDLRTTTAVVAARYLPADPSLVVGGDWYDARPLDDGRLALTVGDVVGSGLPAALVMGQLRSALGAAVTAGISPDQALRMVDAFSERVPGAMCATATCCVVEPDPDGEGATLHWQCAGHPPPILADADDATLLWAGRRAPLGMVSATPPPSGWAHLPPASLVVLYTDGLVERRNEPLDTGLERLRAAVEAFRELPASEVCDRVIDTMVDADHHRDDLALLVLRTTGATDRWFVDSISADPFELRSARQRLTAWLEDRGQPASARQDAILAIGEAMANAVEHGSRLDTARSVGVEIALRETGLVAAITDSGRWDSDAARSAQQGRGRGFQIMEHLARVTVRRTRLGSTVVLELGDARVGADA